MTPSQRAHFFGRLWPAACASQGWDAKDTHQRKRVVFDATGEESMSNLDQDQITLLFNKVKWLAAPHDFAAALTDSDHQSALEESSRRQIIWRIQREAAKAGLNEAWIIKAAEGKCRAYNSLEWKLLPMTELLKFSMTVESRTSEIAKDRRSKKNASARAMQRRCNSGEMPF